METTTILKRRRDSGYAEKEREKKQLKTNSPKPEKQKPQPLQPQQPAPQRPAEKPQNSQQPEKNTHPPTQRPAQIIPPPQQPKSTPRLNIPKPPSTQHYLLYHLFQPPNNSPGPILKPDHHHRHHQHPKRKERNLHQTNWDKPLMDFIFVPTY